MSLFATMTPEQKVALQNMQKRSLAIQQSQKQNKYIPNSGVSGVVAQLFSAYADNKRLDSNEEKQKGLLKQIKADKKARIDKLAEIAGINTPKAPKAQVQNPVQAPVQGPERAPGIPVQQAPQPVPPHQAQGVPQAPQQIDSPATKMIKLGYATGNEKLIMKGMELQSKGGENKPVSPVGKLQFDMERLRAQGKLTPELEQSFRNAISKTGKSASITVKVNNQGNMPLTKSVKSDIQKKFIATNGQLEKYNLMKSLYKSEYSTLPGKFRMGVKAWKEYLGGTLTPEENSKLGAYESWKSMAYGAMNDYIKAITGAAMSETEAKRIRKAIPDPEKDSPTQFKAKMEVMQTVLRMNRARYQFALKNGLSLDQSISLMPMGSSRTPAIYLKRFMNRKSNEYYKSLNSNIPEEDRKKMSVKFLHDNFPAYYGK